MIQGTQETKEPGRYGNLPDTYRVYDIDHEVGISPTYVDLRDPNQRKSVGWYKVLNAQPMAPYRYKIPTATLAAMTTGTTINLGTLSDLIQTPDPQQKNINIMYNLKVGFHSDKYIQYTVSFPQIMKKGGLKNITAPVWDENMSPIERPKLNVKSFGDTYQPAFEAIVKSRYTPLVGEIGFIGMKYLLGKTNEPRYPGAVPVEVFEDVLLDTP